MRQQYFFGKFSLSKYSRSIIIAPIFLCCIIFPIDLLPQCDDDRHSTSALDVATESRVQDAIPKYAPGVTILYVAQRISAVLDLDKIVLLQNGEIVDIGNHKALMERSELYQEIYESQLGSGITAGLEVA